MNKRTIKIAIVIPSIIIMSIFIILQTVIIGMQASSTADKLSNNILTESVNHYAAQFEQLAAESYGALLAMDAVVVLMQEEDTDRNEVIEILQKIVYNNESIFAMWTCWEPNAYDGKDSEYVNAQYHDETGRFVPYTYIINGVLHTEALRDYDDPVAGDYYQGSLKSGKESLADPYFYELNGENTLLYTMTIPVKNSAGQVVGAVGADILLDSIDSILSAVKVMDTGYIFSLDSSGNVITHYNPSIHLTNYKDLWIKIFSNQIDDVIKNGGAFTDVSYSDISKTTNYISVKNISIGNSGKNWVVGAVVPQSTVTASSTAILMVAVILGVVLILVISTAIYFLVGKNLKELTPITAIAQALGAGEVEDVNISVTDNSPTKNEVELLKRAFINMVDSSREQVHALQKIADGDLTVKVTPKSNKDLLNVAVHNMVEQLNHMFVQINTSSEEVNSGANQVSNAAQMLSQGATEQASAIEQLSASIQEVSSQINTNAENADRASHLAVETGKEVELGNEHMNKMLTAMKSINDSSNQISKIIKVIDDIAFQTNILALNAAVEAARAGDAGKGFAVVADEVRSLASKSADAAKQTTTLIAESVTNVNGGSKVAQETANSLRLISDKAEQVNKIITDIANASQNQAESITQIKIGVEQISNVVQTNSATAEESAAASEELSGQANLLSSEISKFKLN